MRDQADRETLLQHAQRTGVEIWPGQRVNYKGKHATVSRVAIENRLEIILVEGRVLYDVQKIDEITYTLTLATGECLKNVPAVKVKAEW